MNSNELLNQVLAENIEKASNGVGQAIDFTMEQAPEVVSQVLMWNLAYSGIKFAASMLLVIIVIFLIKLHIKAIKESKYADEASDHPEILFWGFSFLPVSVLFNMEWLKIYIAPKVWLIEYAASLVK